VDLLVGFQFCRMAGIENGGGMNADSQREDAI
jgi:hypothetical protein